MAVWQVACRLADGLPMAAAGASMGASVTILAGMQLGGCRGFIIESPFADLDALLRRLMPRPLAALAKKLFAKVNLIPYNRVEDLPWQRPSDEVCEGFLAALEKQQVTATLRREKGHDIDAACGQLRLKTERALAGA